MLKSLRPLNHSEYLTKFYKFDFRSSGTNHNSSRFISDFFSHNFSYPKKVFMNNITQIFSKINKLLFSLLINKHFCFCLCKFPTFSAPPPLHPFIHPSGLNWKGEFNLTLRLIKKLVGFKVFFFIIFFFFQTQIFFHTMRFVFLFFILTKCVVRRKLA